MIRRWLTGRTIALSVSPPEDLDQRGMGTEHLHDALGELSRQLLALGARLIYGGDLREGGITRILFELAARYAPSVARRDDTVLIVDVVPYPMHAELSDAELMAWEVEFAPFAQLRYMNQEDDAWLYATRPQHLQQMPPGDWAAALTAMRSYVTRNADARVVLGGKSKGYQGRMPGIAEEAYVSATASQPLYAVGGFGGAAQLVAQNITDGTAIVNADGTRYTVNTPNGLDTIEQKRLAETPHVDEIAVLLTRGLQKLFGD